MKNLAAHLEMSQLDERYNRRPAPAPRARIWIKPSSRSGRTRHAYEAQKQTLAKMKVSLEEQRMVCKAQVQRPRPTWNRRRSSCKNCTISAPTTGIVLSKKAELGGYVNPLAFGAAGYLCEMADLRDLEVDLASRSATSSKVFAGAGLPHHARGRQRDETF